MTCICIKLSDGSLIKVVGCPEHGATDEQIEEIVKECVKRAGCQCALCKPDGGQIATELAETAQFAVDPQSSRGV